MAKTKTPSGLSMKHKIGYACGDLGGCMTFALMGSIVTRMFCRSTPLCWLRCCWSGMYGTPSTTR